jgi:hypothetical protein
MRYMYNKDNSGIQEYVVNSYNSGLQARHGQYETENICIGFDYFYDAVSLTRYINYWDDW